MIFDDQHNIDSVVRRHIIEGHRRNTIGGWTDHIRITKRNYNKIKSMSWANAGEFFFCGYTSKINLRKIFPNIDRLNINMNISIESSSINELPRNIAMVGSNKMFIKVDAPFLNTVISGCNRSCCEIQLDGQTELGNILIKGMGNEFVHSYTLKIIMMNIGPINPHILEGLKVQDTESVKIQVGDHTHFDDELFFKELQKDICLGAQISRAVQRIILKFHTIVYEIYRCAPSDFPASDMFVKNGHWLVKKEVI